MQLFTTANDSDTCTVFLRLDAAAFIAFSLRFGAAFIRGRRLNEEIRYTTGSFSFTFRKYHRPSCRMAGYYRGYTNQR